MSKKQKILVFFIITFFILTACKAKNPVAPEDDNSQTVPAVPETVPEIVTSHPPVPLEDQLFMVGFYSPFVSPDYQSILDQFKKHGLNGFRIFVDNPWNGNNLYEDEDFSRINQTLVKKVKNLVDYANSIGLIVQVPLFNRSAIQRRGWLNTFYHEDNKEYHKQLVKLFVSELEGMQVIFEIDNEGHGRKEFELDIIWDTLDDEGVEPNYITSSPKKDPEIIMAELDLFCLHRMMIFSEFESEISIRRDKKWIYSSDGEMDGSSGIYQFGRSAGYGTYPTEKEMKDWVKKIIEADANFEMNLSGLIEPAGHTLPPYALQLLQAIKEAIEEST